MMGILLIRASWITTAMTHQSNFVYGNVDARRQMVPPILGRNRLAQMNRVRTTKTNPEQPFICNVRRLVPIPWLSMIMFSTFSQQLVIW